MARRLMVADRRPCRVAYADKQWSSKSVVIFIFISVILFF